MQQLAERSTVSPEEVALSSKNFPHARNTGMLTERTPAIDIDIRQADAATTAVEELARERFDGRGTILVRFGEAPKRALLFRTSRPFGKMQVGFIGPVAATIKSRY